MTSHLPPVDPLNPLSTLNPSQRRNPITPTGGGGRHPSPGITSGTTGTGTLPPVLKGQGDTAREWAKDTAAGIEHVEVVPRGGGGGTGTPGMGGLDPMEAQPGVRGVDRGGGEAVATTEAHREEEISPPGAYIPDSSADGGMRAPAFGEDVDKGGEGGKRASLLDMAREYLPERVVELLPGTQKPDLPSTETPSTSRGGVGSLPGNISEASVAKLPEERILEGSIPRPEEGAAKSAGEGEGDSNIGAPIRNLADSTTTAAPSEIKEERKDDNGTKAAATGAGIAAVGAGVWAGAQRGLSSAGQAVAGYLPGHSTSASTTTWTHEPTSLPGTETPSTSAVGVGSLPGNISEVSVAKLPEERLHPEAEVYASSHLKKPHPLANTMMAEPTTATSAMNVPGTFGSGEGGGGGGGLASGPAAAAGPSASQGGAAAGERAGAGAGQAQTQTQDAKAPASAIPPTSPTSFTNTSTTATPGHEQNPGIEGARAFGIGAGVAVVGAGLGGAAYGRALSGSGAARDRGEVEGAGMSAGPGKGAEGTGREGTGTGGNGPQRKESLIQKMKHVATGGLSSKKDTSGAGAGSSGDAGAGAGICPENDVREGGERSKGEGMEKEPSPVNFGSTSTAPEYGDANEPKLGRSDTGAGIGPTARAGGQTGVGGGGVGEGEAEATAEPGGAGTVPGTMGDTTTTAGTEDTPAVTTASTSADQAEGDTGPQTGQAAGHDTFPSMKEYSSAPTTTTASAGDKESTTSPSTTTHMKPSAAAAGIGLGAAAAGAAGVVGSGDGEGVPGTTGPGITSTTGGTTGAGNGNGVGEGDTGKHDPDVQAPTSLVRDDVAGAGAGNGAGRNEGGNAGGNGTRTGKEKEKVTLMDKIKGEAMVISGKIGHNERKIEEGRRMMRGE